MDATYVILRYKCDCAAAEVLCVQTIVNLDAPTDEFIRSMLEIRDIAIRKIQEHENG